MLERDLHAFNPHLPNSSASSFPLCFKRFWFCRDKKGPAEADPILESSSLERLKVNDTSYLLSSTRAAIMLYAPALKKIRPRTRTVFVFAGVTFRLVPLTTETATVD
jgi:hypothetical protein